MTREEAANILDPKTSHEEFEKNISNWDERVDTAMLMGAEALRVEEKEASVVMKRRQQFRGPDYYKPYCGECNHCVFDNDAVFCCWCGARFVTPIPPLPEVEK